MELRGEILEAAAQEASRLELVQSEVREMHRTKASHRELQHLVAKLQRTLSLTLNLTLFLTLTLTLT